MTQRYSPRTTPPRVAGSPSVWRESVCHSPDGQAIDSAGDEGDLSGLESQRHSKVSVRGPPSSSDAGRCPTVLVRTRHRRRNPWPARPFAPKCSAGMCGVFVCFPRCRFPAKTAVCCRPALSHSRQNQSPGGVRRASPEPANAIPVARWGTVPALRLFYRRLGICKDGRIALRQVASKVQRKQAVDSPAVVGARTRIERLGDAARH